jgi:hypothetical protein
VDLYFGLGVGLLIHLFEERRNTETLYLSTLFISKIVGGPLSLIVWLVWMYMTRENVICEQVKESENAEIRLSSNNQANP